MSDVTVLGRGSTPLIVPADGSNVGGFRVGYDGSVSGVALRGLSYDCNPETHSGSRGGFEKPSVTPPESTYGRRGGGVRNVEYLASDRGRYVGARIHTEDHSSVDVFVNAGCR